MTYFDKKWELSENSRPVLRVLNGYEYINAILYIALYLGKDLAFTCRSDVHKQWVPACVIVKWQKEVYLKLDRKSEHQTWMHVVPNSCGGLK